MARCLHRNVQFPAKPVADSWYPCPDCGERVGRRNGRVVTVLENNQYVQRRIALDADQRDVYLDALKRIIATKGSPEARYIAAEALSAGQDLANDATPGDRG